MKRRQFLKAFGGISTLGIAGLGALHARARYTQLHVAHYNVAMPAYPQDYPPLNIAFLSDFHVGCSTTPVEKLPQIVAQTNALKPDLVLLGGDYLDHKNFGFFRYADEDKLIINADPAYLSGNPPKPQQIAQGLSGFAAKYGAYAVLGNHDWRVDGASMSAAFENAGVPILENNIVTLDIGHNKPLQILGLPDMVTRGHLLEDAPFDKLTQAPTLVLSHCPQTMAHVAAWQANHQDMAMLQVSGHTHGGQVCVFGHPLDYPKCSGPQRWKQGVTQEWGHNAALVVGAGIGTSGAPIRNVPPEIVMIHLGHKIKA